MKNKIRETYINDVKYLNNLHLKFLIEQIIL